MARSVLSRDRMREGFAGDVRVPLVGAALGLARIAAAHDADVVEVSPDSGSDGATLADEGDGVPSAVASDGALCDTQSGATCAVSSGSPGRSVHNRTLSGSVGAPWLAGVLRAPAGRA